MTRIPPDADPTPEALARATQTADQIFADTGLDQELESDAYASVQNWSARWDAAIEAMKAGHDDGCPCEACRAQFGPLNETTSTT